MIQTIEMIAEQIQQDLGITPYDMYDVWRQEQILRYYENNLQNTAVTPQTNIHAWFIFDQINQTANLRLSAFDFTLGSPSAAPLDPTYSFNTQISLTGNPLSGYNGTAVYYYNRLNIANILAAQTADLTFTSTTMSLSDLLPQLNTAYGMDLNVDDIIDVAIPGLTVNSQNVITSNSELPISINPASLKYYGSYNYQLDYVNGAQAPATVAIVAANQIYIAYSNPAAALNPLSSSNLLVNVTSNGQLNGAFSFGRNATNVTAFTITALYVDTVSSLLYLQGTFTLDFTVGAVTQTGTFAELSVDLTGLIVSGQAAATLFTLPAGAIWAVNRNPSVRYAVNPSAPIASSLIRYLSTGVVDSSYTYSGPYAPVSAFAQADGTVYIVSAVYSAANPYDANLQVSIPLYRIDRLLATGSVDPTFNPTYISSADINQPLSRVIDITPSSLGDVYVLFNQSSGFDTGSQVIVVNNTPLIGVSSQITAVQPYLPIAKLTSTGLLNSNFINALNVFSVQAINSDPTKTNQPGLWLNTAGSDVRITGYALNPTNLLPSYLPIRLSYYGQYLPYDASVYSQLPIYASANVTASLPSGLVTLQGTLAAVNMQGILSEQKPYASTVGPQGTVSTLNPVPTGSFPSGTVGIVGMVAF